jgi:cyclopropane fatty-acyl-phospholipid synthase-like methyltransferase
MSREPGIVDYYNQTHLGYRLFWGLNRAFSMHYGLHDAAHSTHVDAVLNLIRVLATTAHITPDDEVLDVGCGFGGSAIWLGKNIGCRVTGIDINPTEIAFAKEQARKDGVDDRVRFIEMDYATMDTLDAEAFSVVWQIETLIYADRRKFVVDAYRRLRRGGRIVIADYFSRPGTYASEEKALLDRWVKGWAGDDLITGDEFVGYLQNAGFEGVRFEDKSQAVMPSSRRMNKVCTLTAPLGRALELIGLRTRLQTENSIGAVVQYEALRRGLWVYGIVSGEKRAG